MKYSHILSVVIWMVSTMCLHAQTSSELRMNQIQVLASHNSYKKPIDPVLMAFLSQQDSARFLGLDYSHLPLNEQLDLGIRKLELDIFHDPQGGRFANPLGITLFKEQNLPVTPYDPDGKMNQSGFKVMHVQDIDFRSHCYLLTDCLQEIVDWSNAHPNHLPIAISYNAKSGRIEQPGFTQPLPFTSQAFDSLDQEFLSVIPRDKLITPDDVRGKYRKLEKAVLKEGWPLLEEARGKILMVLDEKGEKMEAYAKGHPSLKGRVMFILAEPGTPEAAFLIINNPIKEGDRIRDLVKKGYMVRTRADAGTKEAREGDYTRLDAALASGAQYISTDYYVPDERFDTNFQVTLPNGQVARCNPVFEVGNCRVITWE